MIVAATGHRPERVGGYSAEADQRRRDMAFEWLAAKRPEQVIVGMALGWDTAVAEAAYNLRIPFVAAVPFPDQQRTWPALAQHTYRALLAAAAEVVTVCPVFSPDAMHRRNMYMVNRADQVLALWDGGRKGGTANCIQYAKHQRVPVVNLWDRYVDVFRPL